MSCMVFLRVILASERKNMNIGIIGAGASGMTAAISAAETNINNKTTTNIFFLKKKIKFNIILSFK